MTDTTSPTSERRRGILAQIGQVRSVIEGSLTHRERKRGGGKARVYHQLQRWRGSRNDTRHVPSGRVDAIRAGIEGYKRVQDLITELAQLDERGILGGTETDRKKKPTTR